MKILTLGDSWTFGNESSDPTTMSWPAQLSKKFNVPVTNLGRSGSSNQQAIRIGIEELCANPDYDWVIWGIAPASRTEILKNGKWHQIYPKARRSDLEKIYADFWHPWNDVQVTMLLAVQFMGLVNMIGPKLLIGSLSFRPSRYLEQMSWILNYKGNNDFASLGMPLKELNIGVKDLDRKLRVLRGIHDKILEQQPDWFYDIDKNLLPDKSHKAPGGHPNDIGYSIIADYFASRIGLV